MISIDYSRRTILLRPPLQFTIVDYGVLTVDEDGRVRIVSGDKYSSILMDVKYVIADFDKHRVYMYNPRRDVKMERLSEHVLLDLLESTGLGRDIAVRGNFKITFKRCVEAYEIVQPGTLLSMMFTPFIKVRRLGEICEIDYSKLPLLFEYRGNLVYVDEVHIFPLPMNSPLYVSRLEEWDYPIGLYPSIRGYQLNIGMVKMRIVHHGDGLIVTICGVDEKTITKIVNILEGEYRREMHVKNSMVIMKILQHVNPRQIIEKIIKTLERDVEKTGGLELKLDML